MKVKKLNDQQIKKQFGEAVRSARLDMGLSQEKLGFETGLDLTSINEIEKGHRSPRLTTACKIAYALGISPSALLSRLN